MKKFYILVLSILFTLTAAFAEPIVELAAPRIQSSPVVSNGGGSTAAKSKTAAQKSKLKHKKHKKHKIKKVKPPVLNYTKTTKLLENGYYDDADDLIQNVMDKNPKDINAPILWVVSQAKQGNLDVAQCRYNSLIKKHTNSSDLHYAKGIIDYKKATSSNVIYKSQSQAFTNSAKNEFKKAISLDKTNAKAYNAAGVVAINEGNNQDAANYFKKALSFDKTYSIALDNLGTVDYLAGNMTSANTKFKQALALNPQSPTIMYHLAQVAYKNNDYISSVKYLDKAIRISPYTPAFYNLKGKNLSAMGSEASAISSFKKSIEIKPELTSSYLDLAKIYANRGDNEFAMEELKTALSINPNLNNAKLELANLSVLTAKYQQAIPLYSDLVNSEYKNAALIGLANAYYGQAQVSANKSLLSSNKDLYNALDCINNAIEANGNNLELHLAKLKLAKLTNQPELTKVELEKIIQSPKNDLITNLLKGEAYSTLNDYQNAEIAFDNAIKQSKTLDDSLYLAEILIYQKQYDNAQKVLQKIAKTYPQNQQVKNGLDYIRKNKKIADNYFESAKIFLKQKNFTVAIEYFNRSIAANPNNSQARLILAQLYESQKDYQEAVVNYKAYVGLMPSAPDAKRIRKKINKLENRL